MIMSDPTSTTGTTQAGSSPAASMTQMGTSATALPNEELGEASPAKKVGLGLSLVLCIIGLAFLIVFFAAVRHWLALHTGTLHGGPICTTTSGRALGSDLGEATLITAVGIGVYTGVRKVNCHTKGCWRIGHHPLDGTPYILCRKHHPYVPTKGASHEHILEQHRKYKEAHEAPGN